MPAFSEDSLKDWCLKCIAANFARFVKAYELSSVPSKYFDFVQRTYSSQLFERLAKRKMLEEQYLFFLINSHLKELKVSYHHITDPESILKRLEAIGRNNIKYFSLHDKKWDEEILLRFVRLLPSVETLILHNTKCSGTVLKAIGEHCQCVSTLDLSFCPFVTDGGVTDFFGEDEMGNMKNNTVLQHLDLTSSKVSNEGLLTVLNYAPSLQTLRHEYVAQTIYDRNVIPYVNNHAGEIQKCSLRDLRVYAEPVTNVSDSDSDDMEEMDNVDDQESVVLLPDVLLVCSISCPSVTRLEVHGELDQSVISACSNFREVRDVELFNEASSYMSAVQPFLEARGSRLRTVRLKYASVPVRTFGDHCHELRVLSLNSVSFDVQNLQFASSCFPYLHDLAIEAADFSQSSTMKAVFFLISNAPRLETLSLAHSQSFSVDVVKRLARCRCLSTVRSLSACYSDLNAVAASAFLAAAPRLAIFSVRCTNISLEEYHDLLQLCECQNVKLCWADKNFSASDNSEHSAGFFLDANSDNDSEDFSVISDSISVISSDDMFSENDSVAPMDASGSDNESDGNAPTSMEASSDGDADDENCIAEPVSVGAGGSIEDGPSENDENQHIFMDGSCSEYDDHCCDNNVGACVSVCSSSSGRDGDNENDENTPISVDAGSSGNDSENEETTLISVNAVCGNNENDAGNSHMRHPAGDGGHKSKVNSEYVS